MKIKIYSKLNSKGILHHVLPVIVIVLFGLIGGAYFVLRSDAAPLAASSTTTSTTVSSPASTDVKANPFDTSTVDGSVTPNTPTGCTSAFGWCFYWVKGSDPEQGTGASVDMLVSKPTLGANDDHSLAELWLGNSTDTNAVEFGWRVFKGAPDTNPRLFAYHWVNDKYTCYVSSSKSCGFVPAPNASVKIGQILPTGKATFRVNYNATTKRWNYYFNGEWIGYFPGTIWSGNFASVRNVHVYGEVSASATHRSQTQMGNGQAGWSTGSAYFSGYKLLGGSTTGAFSTFKASYPYSVGITGAHSFHYGGTP